MATIECRRLTKRYGAARGVENVSFEVQPGEVLGLLGSNGAGKSTLLRVLVDFLHPTRGSAHVLGYDSQHEPEAIRSRCGILVGEFALDRRHTARRMLALQASLRDTEDLSVAHRVAETLAVELDRPFGQLSRGNRQKVGLLLAFAFDPEVLLLDEPTTGLDPIIQERFLDLVAAARDAGKTVILSSHRLDEVERIADRVAVLREGKLVAVEGMHALLERSWRSVSLLFDRPASPDAFSRLPGVRQVVTRGSWLDVSVSGPLGEILVAAAAHDVRDITVARPSLEDVFLHLYGADA